MFIGNWPAKITKALHPGTGAGRQESILNALLAFSISGFSILNITLAIEALIKVKSDWLIIYTFLSLLFFIILLLLSRQGKTKTAVWLLIAAYSVPMFYSFTLWGANQPAALLLAVLIIALSGILIGADSVLISALIISGSLIILTNLQANNIIITSRHWRFERHELSEAITYTVLLAIIALIAWLSARGTQETLRRARHSEAQLKRERDLLEITVRERTEQLRHSETEKLNQLYRLAEFGRLSAGIFHDLVNPLTAISLNLEQISEYDCPQLNTQSFLSQALLAAHKMEGLVASIKKQIQLESSPSTFTINDEIEQIIQIFSYKARQATVNINFSAEEKINLYGDPIKFSQIISNLLANAIEASSDGPAMTAADNQEEVLIQIQKEINIKLSRQDNMVLIFVSDRGAGIQPEHLAQIFEPFFSTKREAGQGLGLGLSSTKNITEKYFAGEITVRSRLGQGSEFAVSLPIKKRNDEI